MILCMTRISLDLKTTPHLEFYLFDIILLSHVNIIILCITVGTFAKLIMFAHYPIVCEMGIPVHLENFEEYFDNTWLSYRKSLSSHITLIRVHDFRLHHIIPHKGFTKTYNYFLTTKLYCRNKVADFIY